MKKKLSLLLAFVLCLTLLPSAYASNSLFSDVPPDHWAYDAIMEANNDGVMTGTASGVFSPSGKLNMAQFVTVLTRAFYNEDVQNSLQDDTWPNRNYDAAEKHNLFSGLTRWAPDVEVTREVMAQMMYNVLADNREDMSAVQVSPSSLAVWAPDSDSIDPAFRAAVGTCYFLDLLSGTDDYGTFAPKGLINRAQTAVIYTRLKKAVNVLSMGTPKNSGTPTTNTTTPGTAQNPGDTQSPQETTEATLTNGMPVTEENVLALIEEYKNGKEPGEKAKNAGFTSYARGSTYDPNEPEYQTTLPDGAHYGIECAKFAFAFSDDIFGNAPYREVTNPWQTRPGDLIHWKSHWAIARENAYSTSWTDAPCTLTVGGGAAGSIGWGDTDQALNLSGNLIAVYTRYPLPSETE